MKLLQINSVANIGSTGRIAEQIGQAAMDAGWESYIAYGREAGPSQSRLIKIGSQLDVAWHGVVTRLFDRHGLASRRATRIFISQVKKIQPDIIHLHNIHGYYLNYQILFDYLAKADIPVVWTLHDCWAMTGHCTHFVEANCTKWMTECVSCPLHFKYPKSFIDLSPSNYRDKRAAFDIEKLHIVTVSNWLCKILSKSFLGQKKREVIYNGVDTTIFTPLSNQIKHRYEIEGQKVLLGVATTWNDSKGLHDYYELSQMLSDDYQIILLGLTSKQIKNLPSNIIGLKRTESTQELAQYYSAADIVLNLSRAETFGLTTVEGFACGTPSIVYDVTASPELITPQTGIVVPVGDLVAVKCAIEEICAKDKAYYSDNCRRHAVENFNMYDNYKKYINLYNKILNNDK